MAISSVETFDGVNVKSYDVIATLDADVQIVIAHELGETPFVQFTPRDIASRAAAWIMIGLDENTVTVAKSTAAGSGGPVASLEVVLTVPNAKELG